MLRKEWRKDAPDLSVNELTERESPITAHFTARSAVHRLDVRLRVRFPACHVSERRVAMV
jgi:hypothetical protein